MGDWNLSNLIIMLLLLIRYLLVDICSSRCIGTHIQASFIKSNHLGWLNRVKSSVTICKTRIRLIQSLLLNLIYALIDLLVNLGFSLIYLKPIISDIGLSKILLNATTWRDFLILLQSLLNQHFIGFFVSPWLSHSYNIWRGMRTITNLPLRIELDRAILLPLSRSGLSTLHDFGSKDIYIIRLLNSIL